MAQSDPASTINPSRSKAATVEALRRALDPKVALEDLTEAISSLARQLNAQADLAEHLKRGLDAKVSQQPLAQQLAVDIQANHRAGVSDQQLAELLNALQLDQAAKQKLDSSLATLGRGPDMRALPVAYDYDYHRANTQRGIDPRDRGFGR